MNNTCRLKNHKRDQVFFFFTNESSEVTQQIRRLVFKNYEECMRSERTSHLGHSPALQMGLWFTNTSII